MIQDPSYEGPAYYYYSYDDMLEFGFFNIEKYKSSKLTFRCHIYYFTGWNSNITDDIISSNQLHGQNMVKNIYENWYTILDNLDEKLIIKNIFSAPIKNIFSAPIIYTED